MLGSITFNVTTSNLCNASGVIFKQYCMKIMPQALHRLKVVTSKVIEPSIYHQSSFTPMNFKRTVILTSSKYGHVTIQQICLPKHCRHRPLKSWCIILEYVNLKTYHAVFRGSYLNKDCTLFPSSKVFFPLSFPQQGFNEAI